MNNPFLIIPPHTEVWYHAIFRENIGQLTQSEIPDHITFEKCMSYRGEIMCPCGRYILEWSKPYYNGIID